MKKIGLILILLLSFSFAAAEEEQDRSGWGLFFGIFDWITNLISIQITDEENITTEEFIVKVPEGIIEKEEPINELQKEEELVEENSCPVLQSISDISVSRNSQIIVKAVATDRDEDVITYSFSGLPTNAKVNNNSFTWVVFDDCEEYNVIVEASDGRCDDKISIRINVPCEQVSVTDEYCEIDADCVLESEGYNEEVEECRNANFTFEGYLLFDNRYNYNCACVLNSCELVKEEKCPSFYMMTDETVNYNGRMITLDEAGSSSVVVSVDGVRSIINVGSIQEVNGIKVTVISSYSRSERSESSAQLGFADDCDEVY